MKTNTIPYQRLGNFTPKLGSLMPKYEGIKERNLLKSIFTRENIISAAAAFLLGRASFAGGIMPFGTAFYACTLGTHINKALTYIFALLGMLSAGGGEQAYTGAAAMLLLGVINIPLKRVERISVYKLALISFAAVLIPNLIIISLQGFLMYDLLKSLIYSISVFAMVFVFKRVTNLIDGLKSKYEISSEDRVSIAIISALALSGLADITILGIEAKNVISVLVILVFSHKYGAAIGSASGAVIGLIVSISNPAAPAVIGSYALCGLLSGVLNKLGKLGSSLGACLGNVMLTVYLSGSGEAIVYLKELVLAIGVFLILPHKLFEAAGSFFGTATARYEDRKGHSTRIREITVERLKRFSRGFNELSRTLREISRTSTVSNNQDISSMFDRVAERVCKDCSLCMHCWDRNFYNTYQVMFTILERLDSKGRVEQNDIPQYFLERCERIGYFVETVNNACELFKSDILWKSKMGESRGLVTQQMEGLSRIISNLASEIEKDIQFKCDMENLIAQQLTKNGIRVDDVIAFENSKGKYEITLYYKESAAKKLPTAALEKAVSHVIGRRMVRDRAAVYKKKQKEKSIIRLVEEEEFRITTGVARMSKSSGGISGDSYTFMNDGNGKFIIALSDGMGAGQKAAVQSKAAICLLEQLIEAGFDKDTAIKIINSVLVLQANDDSFATIDLSSVDLFAGKAEFIKIGAAPAFIIRHEGVEPVKAVSLPAGILNNIEMEPLAKRIESGNIIVMITDGIIDSFENSAEGTSGERELIKFLEEVESINPQEIADKILEKAYENWGGVPGDDMMVLAAKVWTSA
jgi:stage II sporulation protein E